MTDLEHREFYDDDGALEKISRRPTWQQLGERALRESDFDLYGSTQLFMPKSLIGDYVASQGFNVPLIRDQDEWEAAFDSDTAMARSDMAQDYDGLSGLLSSKVFNRKYFDFVPSLHDMTPKFHDELKAKLLEGLRSGEMSSTDYMTMFVWPRESVRLEQEANELGFRGLDIIAPQASTWRYIPGMNLTVFRDPSVDGRYHIKTKPDQSWIFGWTVDPPGHGKAIQYERSGPPVNTQEMIDFYEAIRGLPNFDATQAPLIEMQMDESGEFHFLQYLKTGHVVDPVEPFELPQSDSLIKTRNVRGATDPAGMAVRLYVTPNRLTERMEGQGFFFSMYAPHEFKAQALSSIGSVVVHQMYIGMKDDHWDSAPLYRPEVGIGLLRTSSGGEYVAKLCKLADDVRHKEGDAYVDIKVTANGREATIESDWEPRFE